MSVIPVETITQLNAAIAVANSLAPDSGTLTISIVGDISLTGTAISEINLNTGNVLVIDGVHNALVGGGTTTPERGLFVYAGTVLIQNLLIEDMDAIGGMGGSYGGGGGAGLGGGLFIGSHVSGDAGNVTLTNVSFSGDAVVGGNGGSPSSGPSGEGGGGGGGIPTDSLSGTGGSGAAGAAGGSGGGGGSSGGSSGPFGGGGGGGTWPAGIGGIGGFGGGGGGGGNSQSGGSGGGNGGNGGFGGGGGGGGSGQTGGGAAGSGGFGGGLGRPGNTMSGGWGGGGLAAGGDIFVQGGASLTIGATNSTTIVAGSVFGGGGAGAATPGMQLGSGIFIQNDDTTVAQAITLAPGSGQTLTISGVIADQAGSGGTGVNDSAAAIVDNGAGVVVLSAADTYSGGTTIENGGTVELEAAGAAGTGTIAFGEGGGDILAFSSAAAPSNAIFGLVIGQTLDVTDQAVISAAIVNANTLQITLNSGGPIDLTLDSGTSYAADSFMTEPDGSLGTDIVAALAYGQTIDVAGTVATTETVNNGTLTLFNAGTTAVGTIIVGTPLTTSDFTVQSDNSGGTDVIMSSVVGRYASGVTLTTDPTTIVSTASVSNTGTNAIAVSGPIGTSWVLTNQGTIAGPGTSGFGISFASDGAISNQLGGTITGFRGVYGHVGATTLVNAGVVYGFQDGAQLIGTGAIITNQTGGAITAGSGTGQYGVEVGINGSVTNQSGGLISGGFGIVAEKADTVVNSGTIRGNPGSGIGIYLLQGGTITNAWDGTISGGTAAVRFVAGFSNLVAVVPGAVFTGAVDGGNTVNATSISTLELKAGPGAGTLTGLGANYTHFGNIVVDNLASWSLAAAALGAGYTITDAGTLTNAGTLGSTVTLGTNAVLTNAAGGTISASGTAVLGGAPDDVTVVNAGSIGGSTVGVLLEGIGTVSNLANGTITGTVGVGGAGVSLQAGGVVSNQSSGMISGYMGIAATGAAATVANAGSIAGYSASSSGIGVYLAAGGSVTNQSGASISGYYGIKVAAAAGTVVNAGVIAGNYIQSANNADGVYLSFGGSVTNQAGGAIYARNDGVLITGAVGTVVNLGTIHSHLTTTGDYGGRGVSLADGGLIMNGTSGASSSTASIRGYNYAVQFGGVGTDTLVNYGTIDGSPGTVAVDMATGTIVNGTNGATGALILGGGGANAVQISGAATVTNFGSIVGVEFPLNASHVFGISLAGAGSIGNLGSASLITGYVAVYAAHDATVTNAGTLSAEVRYSGPAANAVIFGGGTNRLIVDPGAVFIGTVSGSGPVALTPGGNSPVTYGTLHGTGTTTLELASGASAGTLSYLGTQFVGFAAGTIDAGAQWTLSDTNTVVAGLTLTDSGSLSASGTLVNAGAITGGTTGIVLAPGAYLSNQTGGAINGSSNAIMVVGTAGTVVNAGVIGNALDSGSGIRLASSNTVTNQSGGTIIGNKGIYFALGAGSVTNNGSIQGNTTVAAGIDLGGGGTVTNQTSGVVAGYYGIESNAAATVRNAGSIAGSGGNMGAGLQLLAGGSVTNQSGGTITGDRGIYAAIQAASVLNQGSIAGVGIGVYLKSGGTVTNQAGDTISGGSYAVKFAAGHTSRLVVAPGAVFVGGVRAAGTSTLELTSAVSNGTIAGVGASVVNFTSLVFDTGARWTVAGNNSASGLGTLGITGFTIGDTIDLSGFVAADRTFASNTLTLGDGASNYQTLHVNGSFSATNFQIGTDNAGGTDITVVNPPTVSVSGQVTLFAGGATIPLTSALTITDLESTTLVSASIAIGTGFLGGDILNFTSQNGISGSYDGSTGTLTLSGTATLGEYQTALQSVGYGTTAQDDPTARGGDLSRTIDWTVNDGTVASNTGTTTLTLIHVAPTITANGGPAYFGGSIPVILGSPVSVSDTDSGGLLNSGTVTIGGFVAGDILSASTAGHPLLTYTYNASTGVLTLSGSDSLAAYQNVLASVVYSVNPADGDPTAGGSHTSRTIVWQVGDGSSSNGQSTSYSTNLTVEHIPPSVTAAGTVNFNGGDSAVALDSGLTVTDQDSGGMLTGATISISTGHTSVDQLQFTPQNGISGSYDAVGGVLTLTGAETIADYQSALQSVTYDTNPSTGNPTNGGSDTSRTITWTVSDGNSGAGISNIGSSTLTTTHIAPSVTAAGNVTFTGGGSVVALDSGIALGDPDSGGDLTGATISIAVGHAAVDVLNFTDQNSITGSFDSLTGVLTLSGTATIEQYTTALASITYGVNPSNGDPTRGGSDSARTIDWVVSDADAGNGISNTGSSTLNTVHVAPTITAGGTVTFTSGGTAVALDTNVGLVDPDSGGNLTGATISIGTGHLTIDVLNFTTQNGITSTFNTTTGVLTLSGTATVGQYQTALDSITYSINPSGGDPTNGGIDTSRAIGWVVNDGVTISSSGTSTLLTVHGIPVVTVGGTVAFAGGGVPTVLDGNVGIVNPGGANLTGATISIASGHAAGDVLNFTNQNGITGSFNSLAGVLTLSGTATVTQYQSALDSITYSENPTNGDPTIGGGDTSRTIGWTVSDGGAISSSGNSTLHVSHTAPTVSASGNVNFLGGGSAVLLDTTLTLGDTDSAGNLNSGTVNVVGFVTGDILSANTGLLPITQSYDAADGVLTLSGADTLADYQAVLDSVTYSFNPANGDPTEGGSHTSRTIDWVVRDASSSNGFSNTGTSTLGVAHTAPSVTSGGTVTFGGGGSAVLLDPGIVVGDPDSGGMLTGATISISAGHVGVDALQFTAQNSITGSFNTTDGVLTLTGTDTVADYQTALRSITYNVNAPNADPTNGGGDTSRTINWAVSDGSSSNGISNTGSSTLDVTHAAPTVTAGGTVTFTGGGSAVLLDAALTVSDPDSGGNLTGATISIASGHASFDVLNFGNQNGITGSFNSGTGVLTLSGTTTTANYQAALESITYSVNPADSDPTSGGGDTNRTIDWVVTDPSSSNGISNTGSSTLALQHIAPTLTASGTVTFDGGGSAVHLDGAVGISAPDSAGMLTGATIAVGSGFHAGDMLSFTSQNNITGSYDSGTGTLTLSGTDTVSHYDTALVSITYSFNPGNADPTIGNTDTSRSIAWQVTDGVAVSNVRQTAVDVVHVAPVIGTSGTVTFSGGGAAVILDSALTVSDADSGNDLTGATISLGAGFAIGDTLNFVNQNDITGSYDAADGILTLSGSDTLANYQTALRSVSYSVAPGNADPTGGGLDTSRTIDWQINDGVAISNTGSSTVNPVHVAPTIGVAGTVTFIVAGAPIVLDGTVAVGDPDSGGNLTGATIAVTGGRLAGDTLNFASQNGIAGSYNAGTGVLTLSGTSGLVNYQTALRSITYDSSAGDPSSGDTDATRTISWSVNDAAATSTVATTTVDIAFPAPGIAGTVPGQTITDEATVTPFQGVSITDIHPGQTETVTITLSNAANGSLSVLGLGSYDSSTGVYTITGTPSAVTGAIDGLVFTPVPHQVVPGDTVTTTFTIDASDTAGDSSSDTTSAVIATAVGDIPAIVGTVADQGVPNQTPSHPFATVSVVDPDVGAVETATVTLSAAGNGALSNLSGGTYNAATGVYSVTGTPTADTAALQALVFTPVAQPNGAQPNAARPNADVTTTGFAISPGGGGIVDTTTSVTSVQQILGLAKVPTNQIVISVSPDGSGFAPAQNGMTNEAVVADPVEGHTYTVPAGYQALFLGGTVDATLSDSLVGAALLVANQGNDELIADAANDVLVPGSGNDSLVGGKYASTVVGGSGAATVFAGTGAMQVIDGSGPISFGGNSNAGSSVFGGTGPGASALNASLTGQNQTASVGSSAATITAAGNNNRVIGGDASLSVTITGSSATIQAGSGSSAIVSSGNAALIVGGSVGGSGSLIVIDTGTNDTIMGGASATTVTATTGVATAVIGGAGSLTFVGGSGTATVMGGTGATSVMGGAGGVVFHAAASTNATVNAGAGTVTIFGASGTTQNLLGTVTGTAARPNFAVAGSGNETLNAASSGSSDWLSVNTQATSASTILIAGTGADTLIAGSAPGSVTMTGGSGTDAFVFFRQAGGGAQDMINNFTDADGVYIEGYGSGSAGALQAASIVGPAGLVLTLNDGTTITFSNLSSRTALNGRIQYG